MLSLIASDEEPAQQLEGTGEPPKTIVVDTRELPPQRARLARFLAWRQAIAAEIAGLTDGRTKIVAQINQAKSAAAKVEEDKNAGAAAIVNRVKRGLDWSLGSIVPRGHAKRIASAMETAQGLAVAEMALGQIDREIAAKEAVKATLDGRLSEFTNRALIEHAKSTLAADYCAAIEAVRDCVTRLEGLDRLRGRSHDGRMVLDLPGFSVAGHRFDREPVVVSPAEVSAAVSAWRALAEAWAKSPKADPDKHLKFEAHNPNAVDNTPYEQRTDIERWLIDAKRVV
jgi:hypothetical protein